MARQPQNGHGGLGRTTYENIPQGRQDAPSRSPPDDPDAQARFREIISAHALLRAALLQLEREYFQLTLSELLKRQDAGHMPINVEASRPRPKP
jgi:hypothetical protein